jgi:hypothetical protein
MRHTCAPGEAGLEVAQKASLHRASSCGIHRIANDKGRYRQLRARSQSSELFRPQPPPNIRNLGSSARMSRFGTEFDPFNKGAWDC